MNIRRYVGAITLSLVVLLVALAPSAAVATQNPGLMATEAAPPPSTTNPPNCKSVNPQSSALGASADAQVTKIAGGGRKYSYALPGLASDEYMTVNEPPAGFDPLAATKQELQEWGFPPKPTETGGVEEWEELVGSYRTANVSPGCRNTEVTNPYLGENIESENWSGYVSQEARKKPWVAVIGTYYQTYNYGSCSTGAAESSWVGLGGANSERFMQTGTTIENYENRIEPWIEIYAGSYHFHYAIPGFPVEQGNYMRVYAGYNASAGIAYFYITNDHTGQTILTEWHLGPQFYDGSTAEWIDEAPYYGGQQAPLLNFNQITWYANTAQNNANQVLPIESTSYWKYAPWHGNHRISWPGALSAGQNFTDFYYTCR